MESKKSNTSAIAEREEAVLKFWWENRIFEKSLAKPAPKGEFVFYEGPPTANGKPGIHHLEARAFKDAIPRYKTMQGFHVRRKGGWDTHGLAVEIQTEKELGLKSKKDIEAYGIEAFNQKCRESVWKYIKEWEEFTDRIGYWIDLKRPYVTYQPSYIESVWSIVAKINEQGLLYKDYKVVPWCPRCGTALSSHELAQGYEDVKDLSIYVKFKIQNSKGKSESQNSKFADNTYLLAWTTTPWTLPGNVGLAVGKDIEYVKVRIIDSSEIELPETYIVAKNSLTKNFPISEGSRAYVEEGSSIKGKNLIGLEYEPLYPFLKDNLLEAEKPKLKNAFKVYPASFVTTTDGTGIVHTAAMYGQDDFELGTKVGLPKHHLVSEDGTFKKEAGFLAGKFVKDEATDLAIIEDLANRPNGGLLFAKEKITHSYPHCWRCHTPLIYFARDSWYIAVSKLRDKLIKENEKINWEPPHIKDGRFGEWLKDAKDWAISRERYWGTPLPVWQCRACGKRRVVSSIEALLSKPRNRYFVVRHGEAENNIQKVLNSDLKNNTYKLTERGRVQAKEAAQKLARKKIDIIFTSPFLRTVQTAEVVREVLGLPKEAVVVDERLREISAEQFDGKPIPEYQRAFSSFAERFTKTVGSGNYTDIKNRVGEFLYEVDSKQNGRNILIVGHDSPIWLLVSAAQGLTAQEALTLYPEDFIHKDFIDNAELKAFDFSPLPHDKNYELDLHRPYVDKVALDCSCGGKMQRVKEVMDVWFDSGCMPFAEDHYPFENKKWVDGQGYPADFISEAIDQTRGWFYTLHGVGVLLSRGKAYKNVICLGHILDAEGKKMSKSLGNVVDPNLMIEKYGADALRFWMYSVNAPGEPKNFDEKTVDEIVKKVFNLASNVLAFYKLYSSSFDAPRLMTEVSSHVLDKWILARLNQLIGEVTSGLDAYKLLEPTRAVKDFIADLSQWYLRRSRERIKNGGQEGLGALGTLRPVLLELSKIMAPFSPFFAEHLYKAAGGEKESVHLEEWPLKDSKLKKGDSKILAEMSEVRKTVSLALEARAKALVKVRQPLAKLKIKNLKLKIHEELLRLVQDEVNVKEIIFDQKIAGEVELDAKITPELEEEGNVRELIRTIQELRKEAKLQSSQVAVLRVAAGELGRAFLERHREEIARAAKLKEIRFAQMPSVPETKVGSLIFRLGITI